MISDRTQRRFRERVTVALESHVARLQASVVSIEHHERPEFLNRLAMLRDQVFVLDHMYMSLFSTCGWILRLGVTLVLLISIHPALGAACGVCAADGVYVDVATGCRACRRGSGARRASAGAASVRHRHDGAAGQGGAGDGHWPESGRPSSARRGNGGTARWRSAVE